MNGMKKIVVSGYFGFDNSGDDAILKAMVRSEEHTSELQSQR